jgi:hypothetical protein
MDRLLLAVLIALCISPPGGAKEPVYQTGSIVSMKSVSCGSQGKRHRRTFEMLCQEYVIRTDVLEYHIRQQGESHMDLLPVGEEAEFRLVKDTMRLRVSEQDGKTSKEYHFMVVSISQRLDTGSRRSSQ